MARSTGIVVTLALLAGLLLTGPVAGAVDQDSVDNSISDGLAWLAALQNDADGSWGSEPVCITIVNPDGSSHSVCTYGDRVARTGLAVIAFINYAKKLGINPFDPSYQYYDEIQDGIAFIKSRAALTPDCTIWDYYPYSDEVPLHTVYETSIAIEALSLTEVSDENSLILQSAVDCLVMGQNTLNDGGWSAVTDAWGSGDSDQFNTGFAAMALDAARDSEYAIDVPDEVFVSSSGDSATLETWVLASQDTPGGGYYQLPSISGSPWMNMLTTGHLLSEMTLTGAPDGDVEDAIDFMAQSWDLPDEGGGWEMNYPVIYATMIGFTSQGISEISVGGTGITWIDEMASAIIASQIFVDDNHVYWNDEFSPMSYTYGDQIFDTEFALLTLLEWRSTIAGEIPTANGDTYATAEDTPFTVPAPGVLANDVDGEGVPLSAVLDAGPASGSLSLGADGSFTYTPDADFSGTDTFTYRANDGQADSDIAIVTITVTPVNDAPVALDQTVVTNEDTDAAILLAATDVEGDSLTYAIVAAPSHGTISGTAPGLVYTPAQDYNGGDFFTFQANDGSAGSNVATVSITILPVNDPPDVNPGPLCLWPPNHQFENVVFVTDPDNDPLTISDVAITVDEPTALVTGAGGKNKAPDADAAITGLNTAKLLRSERSGNGNGRLYVITFTAWDGIAPAATGHLNVCVPHDLHAGCNCVDDGQNYIATKYN